MDNINILSTGGGAGWNIFLITNSGSGLILILEKWYDSADTPREKYFLEFNLWLYHNSIGAQNIKKED